MQKAETAANEKSRASAVAINAELRRTKARLLEEVPKLQRLAVKKVQGSAHPNFCLDILFRVHLICHFMSSVSYFVCFEVKAHDSLCDLVDHWIEFF